MPAEPPNHDSDTVPNEVFLTALNGVVGQPTAWRTESDALQALQPELQSSGALSGQQKASVQSVVLLQKFVDFEPYLAPSIVALFGRLQPLLASTVMIDLPFYRDRQQPITQLLHVLGSLAVGLSDNVAQGMQAIVSQIERIIDALCKPSSASRSGLESAGQEAVEALGALARQHDMRVVKLEKRLKDKQDGLELRFEAEHACKAFLNRLVKSKSLPENIIQFLKAQWYDSMRLTYMREGADSKAWKQAQIQMIR